MLFKIFLTVSLPSIAFLALWRMTEHWFVTELVPFPFEKYGAALGLAGFFSTLGMILFVQHFSGKRRQS